MNDRPHFSLIVEDNESAVRRAIDRGDFVQAFLLIHALVESLLRKFLRKSEKKQRFVDLIDEYKAFLKREHYPFPEFEKELSEFNKRRNRIIHDLWSKGYTLTNKWAEPAAGAALIMYGLLIEWLETFDPDIGKHGFHYE